VLRAFFRNPHKIKRARMGAESPKVASTPTGAVFLSYASQDVEAARRICEALQAAGIEVWLDQSELRGGDAWDRKIRDQIRHCALFIPLISVHSQARLEGYFRREWKFAVERKRDIADELAFLLPVVIDETPERGAAVPEGFHEVQWTRLPGGAVSQEFIQHVSRLLTGDPDRQKPVEQARQPSPVSAPARPAAESKSGSQSRMWLLLIAAAVAVVVGYIGIDRYVLHKRAELSAAPATAANADKSIAVLPFADLSEKHDQEYFADGVAEEILDLLAQIPGLKVIGRTSSFQFKGNNSDLRKIGATLGAAYLLEGSVRRSGTTVKVTVQLIDARDGTHRWSETYEREIADALLLQKQIATAVARELQVSISDYFGPGSEARSAEAHDMYLRGLRDVDVGNRDAELRAVAEMSKAVELDPNYVIAWIGLADAYDSAATDRLSPAAESYRLARLAIDKALTLDPKNADAYAMRAFIRINTWDWSGAEQDIQRSMSLRKTSVAVQAEARLALVRGDLVTAEELLRNVLAIDPLDTYTLGELGYYVYPAMGRFVDADRLLAMVRNIDPDTLYINAHTSISALLQGNYELALRLAEKETDTAAKQSSLAVVYSAMGKADMYKQAIDGLLRAPGPTDYWVAESYAYAGEKLLALQHLERAYDRHSPDLEFLKADPLLANLRTDQGYKALVRKLNLPE
jgi:TolB-like protein/Flp pilus assembly protein TadD